MGRQQSGCSARLRVMQCGDVQLERCSGETECGQPSPTRNQPQRPETPVRYRITADVRDLHVFTKTHRWKVILRERYVVHVTTDTPWSATVIWTKWTRVILGAVWAASRIHVCLLLIGFSSSFGLCTFLVLVRDDVDVFLPAAVVFPVLSLAGFSTFSPVISALIGVCWN